MKKIQAKLITETFFAIGCSHIYIFSVKIFFMLTFSTVLYSISGIAETCLGRGVRNTTAVGWRDLALFAIFEKRHISADQVCVYEFNSKNRQIFNASERQGAFQKNTGTLNALFYYLQKTYLYIKEQLPKRKLEIKFFNIFLFS